MNAKQWYQRRVAITAGGTFRGLSSVLTILTHKMRSAILFAAAFSVLLVAASAGAIQKRKLKKATPKDIITGPENMAVLYGPAVILTCHSTNTGTERIHWFEFGTNPDSGSMISDGTLVLPGHPNAGRYEIMQPAPDQYNLKINETLMSDGTRYDCVDSSASPPNVVRLGSQLIMIEADPHCSTGLPDSGLLEEGDYHTIECTIYFQAYEGVSPKMHWSGAGQWGEATTVTNQSLWSGISFHANRTMEGEVFECKTNFTDEGFGGSGMATNVPVYEFIWRSVPLIIVWPPKNMLVAPRLDVYPIGQQVVCYADANPEPTYYWQSLKTGEEWPQQAFTVRDDMAGNQTMRCHAENTIQGVVHYNDIFINLYVIAPTGQPAAVA